MRTRQFRLRQPGSLFRSRRAPLGFVEAAGWLGRDLLWIDGWLTTLAQGPQLLNIELDGRKIEVEARRLSYARPDLNHIPGASGQILIAHLPDADGLYVFDDIQVQLGQAWYQWIGAQQLGIYTDLTTRLPEKAQYFSPDVMASLANFLEPHREAWQAKEDFLLHRNLKLAAQLLPSFRGDGEAAMPAQHTDLQPQFLAEPDDPLGFSFDQLILVDEHHLLLRGWLWHPQRPLSSLDLVHEQHRIDCLASTHRYLRQDVVDLYGKQHGAAAKGKHGLLSLLSLPEGLNALAQPWHLELKVNGEPMVRIKTPVIVDRPSTCRDSVARLVQETFPIGGYRPDEAAEALNRVHAYCRRQAKKSASFQLGDRPQNPKASLIIPIYGRLELLEYQLALLADEPEIDRCELIYVLDSPDREQGFRTTLFHLSKLYQLPVTGVVCADNVGYANALRLGADQASAELLLLLHADVYPGERGWLRSMCEFHRSLNNPGVVAPKLLYEDGSIQHTGFSFSRGRYADQLWTPEIPIAGLPRRHPAARRSCSVPAVSGACMMVERELFQELDGFAAAYIAGDFEDVDFSLRCLQAGRENWYLADVELYHLESLTRSMGPGWQRNPEAEKFNRWLLTERYDEMISSYFEASSEAAAQEAANELDELADLSHRADPMVG